MAMSARRLYVVSDVHLGGIYPDSENPEDRGFRINTRVPSFTSFVNALAEKSIEQPRVELVINGDFIDFLAERDGDGWTPFTNDPYVAADKLEDIVRRDQPVFDALARLLNKGHTLTILLGNHDIELALPEVRRRFTALLGIRSKDCFQFLFDGEAYTVGNVLIEHGNRYDKFNVVDHDALRRLRSLQSRNQTVGSEYTFRAPTGSHIVAEVMNPIKESYPFIDLLKPETEAAIPILLALEPDTRRIAARIAGFALAARGHRTVAPAMPGFGGDINASEEEFSSFGADISSNNNDDHLDPLSEVLQEVMGDDTETFLQQIDRNGTSILESPIGENISAGETIDRTWGLLKLMFGNDNDLVEQRLPTLLKALRVVRDDQSFDRSMETREYIDPAQALSENGYKCIVFGHTRLPKYIKLDNDATYINTGTWADFMKFPEDILNESPPCLSQLKATPSS